jgi:hypothetical protein
MSLGTDVTTGGCVEVLVVELLSMSLLALIPPVTASALERADTNGPLPLSSVLESFGGVCGDGNVAGFEETFASLMMTNSGG